MRAAGLSPERALPLLRAAAEANPDHLESRRRLARALLQVHDLRQLLEEVPAGEHDPELLHLRGCAAAALGDDVIALDALGQAAHAGHAASHGELAGVLLRCGRVRDAERAARRGLDWSPRDFKSQSVLANVLLARGERARLWELCAELRSRDGARGYVPSAMAHAAEGEAQRREVERLVGEWPDVRSLDGVGIERVRDELLSHPRLRGLPATRSTTGDGARVDRLQDAPGPAVAELLDRARAVLERLDAPGQPRDLRLNAWAVATHGDGHEGWHIHPSGWVSGVVYVAVPVPVAAAGERGGSIEFGPMPLGTDAESRAWPRRRVQPQPGMLLLFPSFYGHRTWPTGSDETRLVVAFDALAGEPVR